MQVKGKDRQKIPMRYSKQTEKSMTKKSKTTNNSLQNSTVKTQKNEPQQKPLLLFR